MSKRKYTHIKEIEPEILTMRKAGYSRQEIADSLGLEKEQVKNWVSRYNREQARLLAGIPSKHRGRPRKDTAPRDLVAQQQYEIKRLKMENELLRDFLQSVGRK